MKIKMHTGAKIHVPVMPEEVISHLNILPNGVYIDGTIGLGGHSHLIISQLSKRGHLIGIDRDANALEKCKINLSSTKSNLSIFKNSYSNIESILDHMGIDVVNGILLDLGLSSWQLDDPKRGFSYQNDSMLDMRFDQSQKTKAYHILNQFSEKELANLIFINGEERRSRGIARNIVRSRPIKTTFELLEIIRRSTPPNKRTKSIARVFQSIRIAVNNELEKLDMFLSIFFKKLCIGGRIVIISFHSIEDRKVKHCFKELAVKKKIKIITKKPLRPQPEEELRNSRSRSAKLRSAEKIST